MNPITNETLEQFTLGERRVISGLIDKTTHLENLLGLLQVYLDEIGTCDELPFSDLVNDIEALER